MALASLAVMFFSCAGAAAGPASERAVRIGGTGAALGLMTRLAAAYTAQAPGAAIEVLPSLGSSGGIRALGEGVIEIAVSARALRQEEAASGLRAVPLSRTPFVLVTSHPEPPGIAGSDLASLYAEPAAAWPDGTPLRIILRPASDSDSMLLERHFSGMRAALAKARQRVELPVAQTDQENVTLARELEGSLTTATLTQVITEDLPLAPLSIDGAAPSLENLQSGRYPYYKDLILVRRAESRAAVDGFLAFIESPRGRRVLRDAGNLPLGSQPLK